MGQTAADIRQELISAEQRVSILQSAYRQALLREQEAIEKTMTCGRRREMGMDDPDSPFVGAGIMLDYWRNDRTCSYCGSLHPDDVFAAIDAGEKLTPTDKAYKLYVCERKFYFQHFDGEQQRRFVDLYNAKKMNLAAPGYFYALPFFCHRPAPTAETTH